VHLRRLPHALALATALAAALGASGSHATTARDLGARLRIDGNTSEWAAGEAVFGYRVTAEDSLPEEASDDSRWGVNNDLNQIRVTWDAKYLYLAGEGRTWDNNMILFIDSTPGRGLAKMDSLNSWRRNFAFDTTGAATGAGFTPDLFGATWDTNLSPRLVMQLIGQRVEDYTVDRGYYAASASFDKGNTGRSMELAIPWRTVFLGPVGLGTRDTLMTVDGVPDTFQVFPPGTKLKIAGVVTAGGDGTGGPDVAPDNTRGMSNNSSDLGYVDNWAIIDLDRNDDTGRGRGGPDGVADWGVDPKRRVTFRFNPPIFFTGIRQRVERLDVDRPAFAPDRGEVVRFAPGIVPPPDLTDEYIELRTFTISANVFDMRGRFIRNLYVNQTRRNLEPLDPDEDLWDGRDASGAIVPAGVYVIRTVLEPNLSRAARAVVVVR
jgi:hypothetical protein